MNAPRFGLAGEAARCEGPAFPQCAPCVENPATEVAGIPVAQFTLDGRLIGASGSFADHVPHAGATLALSDVVAATSDADSAQLRSFLSGSSDRCTLSLRPDRADSESRHAVLARVSAGTGARIVCALSHVSESEHRRLLREIALRLAGVTGQRYLDRFVSTVATLAHFDSVMVVTITQGERALRVMASSERTPILPGAEFALRGSAVAELLGRGPDPLVLAGGAAEALPLDPQVVASGAESFAGIACRMRGGGCVGAITVTNSAPLADRTIAGMVLQRFAGRIALEIQRARHAATLRRKEKIRALVPVTPDSGVWIWDVVRDSVHASARAAAITGARVRHLDDLIAAVVPAERGRVSKTIASAVREPRPFRVEFHVSSAIEPRKVEIDAVPDLSEGRMRFVGTVRDSTARALAADTLAVLSRAVEQAADHMAVIDRSGIVIYMNAAWRNSAGDHVGRPVRQLLGGRYVHEEVTRAVRGGSVFRDIFQRFTPGGLLVYEETAVSEVVDTDGQVTSYVVVATDITDRVMAEDTNSRLQRSLRRAAEEWRVTVDALKRGIVLFDATGKMLRMNRFARDLLGGIDYSFVGKNIAELVLAEPWLTVQQLLHESEERSLRQVLDDEGKTWEVSVVRWPDAAGGARSVVHLVDVTERLALEQSVRRSHVMSAMGDLVAGVAHEVRNPIFGISATLDAFEANLGENSEFRPYSAMLRKEIERLKVLTRDLLDYGRPVQAELAPACLGRIVATAVDLCLPAAQKQNVIITNRVDASFGDCRADAQKLERALRNVVENAVQHSRAGDCVTITAEAEEQPEGTVLVCRVSDRGPGFATRDLPRIFQPFFSRRSGGTGLGLSIVHRAVEEHGGRVTAANAPEGGAIVTIAIPVLPAAVSEAAPRAE